MFVGCSASEDKKETKKKREFSVPVQIGKVVYKIVEDQVRTIGVMLEEKRVVIPSEIEGKVINIFSEEGMKVKAEDILARIDPTDYQLEVERLQHVLDSAAKDLEMAKSGARPEVRKQLEAKENAAKSSLDLALKNQSRIKALVEDGVMAQSTLDTAMDEVNRSKEELRASQANREAGLQAREEDIEQYIAQIEGVQKQYDQAMLNLEKTVIRAPFDGVIIKKKIDQGEFAESKTPIVEMIMSPKVIAGMTLPQRYRNKLNRLEGIEIYIKELDITIRLDKEHCKRIQVIPDANIYSGNFYLWIDLPKHDSRLFPGLTFQANLFLGRRKNVLHVSSTALVISEKGTVVYIVKDGKAHIVPVHALNEKNGFVEIKDFTKQLKPDADLILRGAGAVFPEVRVKIVTTNL